MFASNRLYNEGLEKAGVRDLTGAVISLRQCLRLNKNHIKARNLLGLIYFEMGEVVAALSEWVISKNLHSHKNIADVYIAMIQENSSRLEAMNQTIKKYNQALTYCRQDSKDLAVIQLKKVLSLNPNFIRAHQLLALLYLDGEQWEKAGRELTKCLNIDRNNTLGLRYRKEVDGALSDGEDGAAKPKSKEVIRYRSDNELIIQPMNVKEPKRSGGAAVLNIGIGLIIGLAAMYFLVVPAAVSKVRNEAQGKVVDLGNQMDAKTAQITQLETQIKTIQEENAGLHEDLQGYVGTDGTLRNLDLLMGVAAGYLETQDVRQTAEGLENVKKAVNLEEASEAFRKLYDLLVAGIGPEISRIYGAEGEDALNDDRFAEAIEILEKAVYYDDTNGNAYYHLAHSYRKNEDKEKAVAAYQRVIELLPGTERAARSKQYVADLTDS
ncbi:MAG: tetratricopeptide repeat protein [Clostridium sp.]|nr:tetratricopeptide repeat protein [Clostridium sp.]